MHYSRLIIDNIKSENCLTLTFKDQVHFDLMVLVQCLNISIIYIYIYLSVFWLGQLLLIVVIVVLLLLIGALSSREDSAAGAFFKCTPF